MRILVAVALSVAVAGCSSEEKTPERVEMTAGDHVRRGNDCLASGSAKAALGEFREATRLDPNLAAAWYGSAMAKKRLGDPEGAMQDLTKAIERNFQDSMAWYQRGKERRASGNVKGAIEDFTHAIGISSLAEYHRARGHAYYQTGEWAAAAKDLSEAADLTRSVEDLDYIQLELFVARVRAGRVEEAEKGLWEHRKVRLPRTWAGLLSDMMLGKKEEKELLGLAETREKKCELGFYAGMKRLFSGDRDGANRMYLMCMENRVADFVEPDLAQSELTR